MGFSRQEHWSGLPFPYPEGLSNPGIEPRSSALQADSLLYELKPSPSIKTRLSVARHAFSYLSLHLKLLTGSLCPEQLSKIFFLPNTLQGKT